MGLGLEVRDESGRVIMNSATHVSFVLGIFDIQGGNGEVIDDRLLEGEGFVILPENSNVATIFGALIGKARAKIEGNKVIWNDGRTGSSIRPTRVVYGIIT